MKLQSEVLKIGMSQSLYAPLWHASDTLICWPLALNTLSIVNSASRWVGNCKRDYAFK